MIGMKGERDSFVFYRSFMETVEYFAGGEQKDCLFYAVKCLLGDMDPHNVPYPYGAAIIQMLASVKAAKDRHEKAVENGVKGGEKGGRPKKWIEREEADALYAELKNWRAVADALDVDEDTLRKLRYAWDQKAEKPKNRKNPNVNVNDNVNDNVNVNVNDIIYKEKGANGALTNRPVLPQLKPGEEWTSEPMRQRNSGLWVAFYKTASGEERCMALGEQGV